MIKFVNSLAGICVLVLLVFGISGHFPTEAIRMLFIANLVVSISCGFLSMSSERRGALDLIFWVFTGGLILVPGLFQVSRGEYVWPPVHTPHDIQLTLLVILIGQVSYLGGALTADMRARRKKRLQPIYLREKNASLVTILAMMVPGILAIALIGPAPFLLGRQEVASSSTGWPGQVLMVGKSLLLVAMLVLCAWLLNAKRNSKTISAKAVVGLAIALLPASLILSPLSSSRNWFMASIVAIFVLWGAPFSSKQKTFWVPGLLLLFVSVMQAVKGLGATTGTLAEKSFSFHNPFNQGWLVDYLLTTDFDSFQTTMNPIIYFGEAGLRYGYDVLGMIFFWIPSSLWPTKPLDAGALAAAALGYNFTNLGCPIFAECYVSFGWAGVVLGMFGLGYGVAAADWRMQQMPRRGAIDLFQVFYACFVGFFPISLRGPLNGTLPQYGFALLVPGLLLLSPMLRKIVRIGWRSHSFTTRAIGMAKEIHFGEGLQSGEAAHQQRNSLQRAAANARSARRTSRPRAL